MRERQSNGALSVQAIAGTHVVLMGMDLAAEARAGFAGFAIKRREELSGKEHYLGNFLLFEANDRGVESDHSSWLNPIQGFHWGDYVAAPATAYTYTVSAMRGAPGQLEAGETVEIEITTEDPGTAKHGVYFNRGAAGSQGYEHEFGDLDPDQVPDRRAYKWLSRGLEEALLAFIGEAGAAGWGLRAAVYEFDYLPILDAFGSAASRGADVKVIVDEVDNATKERPKAEPATKNEAAITTAAIEALCVPRRNTTFIPHNKFIVLLEDEEPQAVWTGSTNLTKGGIFGHSNVGHIVRDKDIALAYLEYWERLSGDPDHRKLQALDVEKDDQPEQRLKAGGPELAPPADSISTVFSPRSGVEALDWYAQLMDAAKESVFMTEPFSVGEEMRGVFAERTPYLRYLMLDNENGKIKVVAREIEANKDNEVAVGADIGNGPWHQWLREHLTGFNNMVHYIHTKYILIDPLGTDPVIVTGSANFSAASTSGNDENMLVIRGDTAVADVYLGEFMRLFSAFRLRQRASRDSAAARTPDTSNIYLSPDPSWSDPFYEVGSAKEKERRLFSGSA